MVFVSSCSQEAFFKERIWSFQSLWFLIDSFFPNVFGIEVADPAFTAEVEGFFETKADEYGSFTEAIPYVVGVVWNFGMVG